MSEADRQTNRKRKRQKEEKRWGVPVTQAAQFRYRGQGHSTVRD